MREVEQWARSWGTEERARSMLEAVEQPTTAEAVRRHASWQRLSASPGDLIMLERMNAEIDVRPVLPVIHVPTLVLDRSGDEPVAPARWMAEQIPGAQFIEAPGHVHIPYFGDSEFLLRQIEDFLTGICAKVLNTHQEGVGPVADYGVIDLTAQSPLEGVNADFVPGGPVNLTRLRSQLEEIRDALLGITEEEPEPGKFGLQTLEIDLTIGAEGTVWFIAKGSAEASIKLTFGRGS